MKTIIMYLTIILTASLLYGQSTVVYDAGTSLYVGAGADLCAGTITVNGTFSGGGTFCNSPVGVEDEKEENFALPKKYDLAQNYPNPFNPSTKISWQSPISGHQTLKVYDVLGNEVVTLVDEFRNAGIYEIEFNATGLKSSVYFYKLQAGGFLSTKKMILIK